MLFDTTQIALERAMQGASLRQSTLASNLANAETPGYQRMDVDFHSTLSTAMAPGGKASHDLVERAAFSAAADPTAAPTRADGSTVDVDAEGAKLAANALEHQAAVQVARVRVGILQSAMGAR